MCYFGNEIQQDDYGSQTATLLEKLFRATRILDLERLPKHDPTRFILAGKGRAGVVTDKAKSDIWQQHRYRPLYVRMGDAIGPVVSYKKRESLVSREKERRNTARKRRYFSPRLLLSLYSLSSVIVRALLPLIDAR